MSLSSSQTTVTQRCSGSPIRRLQSSSLRGGPVSSVSGMARVRVTVTVQYRVRCSSFAPKQRRIPDGGNYRIDSPPAVLSRPRLPRSSACRNPRLQKPSLTNPTYTPGSATAQRSLTATSAATVASSPSSAYVGVRCHCGWRRRHLCWCRRQPRAVPDLGRLRGAVAQWQPRVSFAHNGHMQQHIFIAKAAERARQVLSGRGLSCRPTNHVGRLRLLPRLGQSLGCESLRRPHDVREWPHCQLRHVFKQRTH